MRLHHWFTPVALFLSLSALGANTDVVINEIMYNPSASLGPDNNYEYVELFNRSASAIPLTGWVLRDDDDAHSFVFPSTSIGAGQYLVVCRNPAAVASHYGIANVTGPVLFNFGNGGDSVRLFDNTGTLIDSVAYGDNIPWPPEPDGTGSSLELVNPLLDNSVAGSWQASTPASNYGTPGTQNSRFTINIPPMISGSGRSPQSPTSAGPVTLTAQVVDPGGVSAASIKYNAGGGWLSSAMFDDGAHGDGAAGDFVYGGSVPAQPDGTLVRYYFAASDGSATTTLPAIAPADTFLYRVENSPAAPGDVVINEIMYNNPMASPADIEWIELYNTTGGGVYLGDWTLTDSGSSRVFRFPARTLGPGEYLVIANNRSAVVSLYGLAPSLVIGDIPFSLSDGGETVFLHNTNGVLMDEVEYNDRLPWPRAADGQGSSLECVDPTADNSVFSNWAPSTETYGTPGRANSRLGAVAAGERDIVINEIMYHPVGKSGVEPSLREFIELYNRGGTAVNLAGWQFVEGTSFTFPSYVLNPGQYVVVYKDLAQFTAAYGSISNKVGPMLADYRLSDDGEDIALANANGVILDYVDYRTRDPWPVSADGDGYSLELVNPNVDNDKARNWRNSIEDDPSSQVGAPVDPYRDADERYMNPDIPHGTPGAQNDRYATNNPPYVTRVRYWPGAPTSVTAVTITARVRDPNGDGISNVTLYYKPVAPGQYVRKSEMNFASWTPVAMQDNGLWPDAIAGDGTYSAAIPPQPHRTLVRYRIRAVDSGARSVIVPYEEDPVPNYAYFVYDGVPDYYADNGRNYGKETAAEPPRWHRNLAGPGKPPVYHLLANRADVIQTQYLIFPFSSSYPERSVERAVGSFIFEYYDPNGDFHREVYDHILFRVRGGVHRYDWPKRSWRIRFRKGQQFHGVDAFGNRYPRTRRQVNLNSDTHNNNRWRGEGGIAQALSYWWTRRTGAIGSRTTFVQFRVICSPYENGEMYPDSSGPPPVSDRQYYGDFYGIFTDIQEPGEEYIASNDRDPDGNLYEFRDYAFDHNLSIPGTDIHIARKTNNWSTDFSDFDSFVAGYMNSNLGQRKAFVDANLAFEHYYPSRAVTLFVHHYDQGIHNYMYYHDPIANLWEVAPWDMDNTVGNNSGSYTGTYGSHAWGAEHLWDFLETCQVGGEYPYLVGFKNESRSLSQLMLNYAYVKPLLDNWDLYMRDLCDADEDRWDYVQFPFDVPSGSKTIGSKSYNWATSIGRSGQVAQEGEYRPFATRLAQIRSWLQSRETSSEIRTSTYGYVDANIPNKPTNVSPPHTSTISTSTPLLLASGYSDPNGDPHAASQWLLIKRSTHPWTPEWDWMDPVWKSPEITAGSLTSVTVPPGLLEPATEYSWRVRYKDSTGRYSYWSDPTSFTTIAAPGAPTITAVTALQGAVRLQFTAVAGATGYRVLYGTRSGNYGGEYLGSGPPEVVVPNLVAGFTYYFVIEAKNGVGWGTPSNEVSAIPQGLPASVVREWRKY